MFLKSGIKWTKSFIWSPRSIMYLKLLIFKKNTIYIIHFYQTSQPARQSFVRTAKVYRKCYKMDAQVLPKLIIYASLTFVTWNIERCNCTWLGSSQGTIKMAPAWFEPWNQNCLLMIRPKTTFHQEVCISSLVPR